MSIQDNNALALDALSILKDLPPNRKQPDVKDGIHLRWSPGNDRGFPLKGGYYLFRRRIGGTAAQTCLMPRLRDRDPVVVGSQRSIDTGIGTLAAGSDQLLQPRSLGPPGTLGIGGFAIDQLGLRFSLPANTTTSGFTVRLRFSDVAAPQAQITTYLGAVKLSTQIVAPPPYQQTTTVAVTPPGADAIQISGVAAELVEVCYARKLSRHGPPIPTRTAKNTTPQSTNATIPGQGWEIIPNLTSVIKLPLIHPQFPATPGSESLNASMAIARSRVHYGAWEDSFSAATPTAGTGKITLTNGSPMVTGSGTNWTAELVGKLIYLPSGSGIDPAARVTLAGSDYTAYAVMVVLGPDRIVLSRSYSGPSHNNVPYEVLVNDDFAELHDQVASLLQSPNDIRAAIVPPPLDQGAVAGGKCLMVFAGGLASQVNGIGTQWTTSLAGCYIEIGPSWFQGTYLAGSSIYRIQAVSSPSQLTLNRPFSGLPHFAPFAKCDYRIFARATGDDPNSDTPSFDFKPMDLLELASLTPSYAQALGLYWIDKAVKRKDVFDYIVIADHENRFSQQVGNALDWLNGTPDFTGDSVDGFVKLGVKHLGSPPLAAPDQLELFRLPTGGARVSIANPDRADSDVGVSVLNAASWADPNTPQPAPVMLNLSRVFRGADAANLGPVGNDAAGYDDLGRLLPSRRDPAHPAGWPTNPIHFVDSGLDRTGLDVGWYSYRAYAIDLYGRFSRDSAPIPWKNIDNSPATVADAIHLRDTMPPPPPAGVLVWMLDDRDPYVRRDAAFLQWRSQFPGAKAWANWQPGTPLPAAPPVVGLRLNFRWPWSHQNQGPDLKEFRVYALENPINARTGRVTSVSPVSGEPTESLLTLDLDAQDNTPVDSYIDASLQAGNRAFTILASQTTTANQATTVQLTVRNGGPQQMTPPDSNVDGAIVISLGHSLHKELLDPGNWEKWLAAIPHDLAGTRYEIDMVEDPSIVTADADATDPPVVTFDAKANTFVGAEATWNGLAFVLDAIPSPHDLAAVRPGIDVLAVTADSPAGFYVLGIKSVQASSREIVPVQAPDPVPVSTTTFSWRIGRANAGVQGLAGVWDATNRSFSLDGNPDLSNVSLGADLIYIAAPGATPANLKFFFAIEALAAATRTLTLKDTIHLNALPDGASFPWQIGRPVRHYEVFLSNPPVPGIVAGPDLALPLLEPTLSEPVRHGTIGVSSADYRNEVADQYSAKWPTRDRKGNESWLSGPAPVFRVMRDVPPPPTYTWNATRLYATRANYHDDSYFTVRWDNPGAGYHAHVFRAMDNSLFLAHWKLDGLLPTSGLPPPVRKRLGRFEKYKTQYAAFKTLGKDAEAQLEYSGASKLYDQLDDATLSWLAGRDELADAYMQVTINPLDLADSANGDRLGPDDDPQLFSGPNPAVCAYLDKLPGKSRVRYFYRVMLLDGAQNRGMMGLPTPPVYLPKVVPPRAPVITKVLGGDRQISIKWASNREPDVVKYGVYRSDAEQEARDIRFMTLVHTEVGPFGDPETRPAEVMWIDAGVISGRPFWYRVVVVDTAGNVSKPSAQIQAQAFRLGSPPPPDWVSGQWNVPGDAVLLEWSLPELGLQFIIQRRASNSTRWLTISEWLAPSTTTFDDPGADPAVENYYRVKSRDGSGNVSVDFVPRLVPTPGS
jgi:hypothetical protein